MIDATTQAIAYLKNRWSTFWTWADSGEAIAWYSGETICFREELKQILQRLSSRGLPSLETVLLALMATREAPDKWEEIFKQVRAAVGEFDSDALQSAMQRVPGFPSELRTTIAAKAELVEMILSEGRYSFDGETATEVVRLLSHRLPEEIVAANTPRSSTWVLSASQSTTTMEGAYLLSILRILSEGINKLDEATLRRRLDTGLDTELYPVPVDIPPPQLVRGLLVQWANDEELGGVARLAKQVLAALSVPRPLTAPEEMPEGGVSDLTNRGPLDRLLLSELAHDNLTLAVRVAMNEALYLRREQPPSPPPRQRAILLEAGLRSWGVPRVLTTAVALALVASAERDTPSIDAYRAEGNVVVPVDLLSRNGVLSHLQCLRSEIHPGPALELFHRQLKQHENAGEVFLIVPADVYADPDFLRDLAASQLLPALIATVNRSGEFVLRTHGDGASRILNTARLDIDAVHRPSKTTASLRDPRHPRDLPAICSVHPFPLRLPHPVDSAQAWNIPGVGIVSATNDRRLTLWTAPKEGPQQLLDDAPEGKMLACRCQYGTALVAIFGSLEEGRFTRLAYSLPHGPATRAELKERTPNARTVLLGTESVMVIGDEAVLYNLFSGQPVKQVKLPDGLVWQHDRFFQHRLGRRWSVLSWELLLDPVDFCSRNPLLLAVVQCPSQQGFIGLTIAGYLETTTRQQLPKPFDQPPHSLAVTAIARDGSRIAVQYQRKPDDTLGSGWIEVAQGRLVSESPSLDPRATVERCWPNNWANTLFTQFATIAASTDGTLQVPRAGLPPLAITFDEAQKKIRLAPREHRSFVPSERSFANPRKLEGRGYVLREAHWPSGDRIFWDSRGMLHLKPRDGSLPELSLVLHRGEMAGWTSEGVLWGHPYFTGQAAGDDTLIYERILRPFVQRLTC